MKPRVFIDRIEFDIVGERDERGALDELPIEVGTRLPDVPARLISVSGSIKVFAKNRKGEGVEIGESTIRLLEKHTEARCPVANMMIASGCLVEVEWVDGFKGLPTS